TPLECHVFLLNRTITPSQERIFNRHLRCHTASSQGSLTDLSINSNGVLSFFACATKKSLYFTSSMAKLINIFFLEFRPDDFHEPPEKALIRRASTSTPITIGHILGFLSFDSMLAANFILVRIKLALLQLCSNVRQAMCQCADSTTLSAWHCA